MTTFLVLIVVIVVIGGGVLALRNRSEQGIESGISSFRREMRALAPRPGDTDPASPSPRARPIDQDPGVHVLGDHRPDDGREAVVERGSDPAWDDTTASADPGAPDDPPASD